MYLNRLLNCSLLMCFFVFEAAGR